MDKTHSVLVIVVFTVAMVAAVAGDAVYSWRQVEVARAKASSPCKCSEPEK
jgi:hypothetical protein